MMRMPRCLSTATARCGDYTKINSIKCKKSLSSLPSLPSPPRNHNTLWQSVYILCRRQKLILCERRQRRWQRPKQTKKHLMYGNRIGFWLKPHGPLKRRRRRSAKVSKQFCKSILCNQHTHAHSAKTNGSHSDARSKRHPEPCCLVLVMGIGESVHVFTRFMPSQTETLKFSSWQSFLPTSSRPNGRPPGEEATRRHAASETTMACITSAHFHSVAFMSTANIGATK